MLEPNDVMKDDDKDWEQFKKDAMKDELFYNGPGDLLDTPEGRAKFCRLNESSVFRKPDPNFPHSKIWVFNVQGQGMVIKKRSRVDTSLMENVEGLTETADSLGKNMQELKTEISVFKI